MLIFNNDWTWRGKGILSPRIRNCETIQGKFSALIEETKEAGEKFRQFLKNDNRLIGQERHDLAEELEDLLGGFFYLYKYIVMAQDEPFDSQYCEKDKHFTVGFEGALWRSGGILKMNALSGSFADWFNQYLIVNTGVFIKDFGAAFSDGIMDSGERELLLSSLNELIFQILCAEKGLKSGVLS